MKLYEIRVPGGIGVGVVARAYCGRYVAGMRCMGVAHCQRSVSSKLVDR